MEYQDDDSALMKLAEAVSDGMPVDWHSRKEPLEQIGTNLEPFRVLAKVAAGYRSTAHPRRANALAPAEFAKFESSCDLSRPRNPATGKKQFHLFQARYVGWLLAWVALIFAFITLSRRMMR
jgi:hypothetical protein